MDIPETSLEYREQWPPIVAVSNGKDYSTTEAFLGLLFELRGQHPDIITQRVRAFNRDALGGSLNVTGPKPLVIIFVNEQCDPIINKWQDEKTLEDATTQLLREIQTILPMAEAFMTIIESNYKHD